MNLGLIQRIVGMLLMGFGLTMLPPLGIGLFYGEGIQLPFAYAFAIVFAAGALLWFPHRRDHSEMRLREGFLSITLFWTVLSGAASLPFHLADGLGLTVTGAFFEAVSGFTTTGATVIIGIDELPYAFRWYRQQLQWLGGLSVAVITIAALPVLGVGGMQFYRGSAIGPSRHDKLLPRLRETAKVFLGVYAVLTILCALAYGFAGMSWFDAVTHAFSTVSTGGFSTHDANMAWFQSDLIELICIVFMAAGGISLALHYATLRDLSFRHYFKHPETRTFLLIMLGVAALASVYLVSQYRLVDSFDLIMNGVFQVVAVMTTTGFRTESFADWPGFLPVLLIFLSIMGACVGSTTGGMKTVRFLLVYRQGVREVRMLIHPNVVAPVKLGRRIVPVNVTEAVWGFFAAYTIVYAMLMLLFLASGLDQVSAFSAVAATLNNLGPGLETVAESFIEVSAFGQWVGIAGMLLGRLEIFVLLVLFTPEFWSH